MAKLTKSQMKQHEEACRILEKDTLTWDDKWFVYENWNEAADHNVTANSAYFTPIGLARDFAIDVCGTKVIDLCAGIGALSFAYYHCGYHNEVKPQITCIEINQAYVEIGKKLLPEATWICADVFDPDLDLGHFDSAISNPPFGRKKTTHLKTGNYTGSDFEYLIIDLASRIADFGTFIIPQNSAPFKYSGAQYYQRMESQKHKRFFEQTKISMEAGCGVDTTYHQDDWKTAAPIVEITCAEFEDLNQQSQLDLFQQMAC